MKDPIELEDVLEWADGILGALGTEYARTVEEKEVRIAQAIENQLRLEQLASDKVFKVRVFFLHPTQFQFISHLLEPRFRSPEEAAEFIRSVFSEEYMEAALVPDNEAAADFLAHQHFEWDGQNFQSITM